MGRAMLSRGSLLLGARALAGRRAMSTAPMVQTEALATMYPAPTVGTPCPVYKSDAEARIALVPPIEVAGAIAKCDGGGGPLGHPLEFIQLNTKRGEPVVCKYCGLRFVQAG